MFPNNPSFSQEQFAENPPSYLLDALTKGRELRLRDVEYFDLMVAYLHSSTLNVNISDKNQKITPHDLQIFRKDSDGLPQELLALFKFGVKYYNEFVGWIPFLFGVKPSELDKVPSVGDIQALLSNYQYPFLSNNGTWHKIGFIGAYIQDGYLHFKACGVSNMGENKWVDVYKPYTSTKICTVLIPFNEKESGCELNHKYPLY